MDDQALANVTVLMMVRHMPEDDFMSLCERVANSQGFTLDGDEHTEHRGTSSYIGEQSRTVCAICGETALRVPLTEQVEALAGLTACKRCIDAAILALFIDEPEPPKLASQLSVIFRRRRRAETARRAHHRVG